MTAITWTEPQLCTYDGDLSQSWFVYFDITDQLTGTTIRKQFRSGINYWKSRDERTREGNALKKFWKIKLESGTYNPFRKISDGPVQIPTTVEDAIRKIHDLKKTSLKEKSRRNYNDISRMFINWLTANGYNKLKLYQFTGQFAQAYMDYLIVEKKYAGRTYNNQLGMLNTFFNMMALKSRKWIAENPFSGIEKLPTDMGKNLAYSNEEAALLSEYLQAHDRRLYYAVNFTYHCFIRKRELVNIKVGDIDWENRTIRLNSADTKNRIQDSVTIPDGLHRILLQMGLDLAPKHFYIFGKGLKTCETKCPRPDDISDRHLKHKLAAGFPKDDGKAYYSWKHTGVIAYWKAVKDPYVIQRQCRHSDLKMTMIYMKSLGLSPNLQIRSVNIDI